MSVSLAWCLYNSCPCIEVEFLELSVPTAGWCSSMFMISFKLITISGTAHGDKDANIAALWTLRTILDEQLAVAIELC